LVFSEIITPALTTFKQPIKEMARKATEELISVILRQPREQSEYRYTSELVVRESVERI